MSKDKVCVPREDKPDIDSCIDMPNKERDVDVGRVSTTNRITLAVPFDKQSDLDVPPSSQYFPFNLSSQEVVRRRLPRSDIIYHLQRVFLSST